VTIVQAKRICFSYLATDCYHHAGMGVGTDAQECVTEKDKERIELAWSQIQEELIRRSNGS
jgi:hypothetical protein